MPGSARRRVLAAVVLTTALVGLTACGGASSSGEAADPTTTVTVSALVEQTGAIAYAGKAAQQGMEVGVDYVNESGMLGDRKLKLEVRDAASNPATTGSLTQQIASSDSVAMLGPLLSNGALAAAPIAQRNGLPMIAVQANAPGVVETGPAIFRVTAPLQSYNRLTVDYLKKQGVKTLGMVYPSDVVSTSAMGRDLFPGWAKDAGIETVASESNPSTATDFSAAISKLVAANPDAIGMLVLDTQLPALIEGLRQSGYRGLLFTHSIQRGTLEKIGAPADGMLWAADFSSAMSGGMSTTFIDAYRKKFGTDPQIYNANGFDSVLFLAEALRNTPDAARPALLASLTAVAAAGFDGATGKVSFPTDTRRDARVPGVMVEWSGGQERIVGQGTPGLLQQ